MKKTAKTGYNVAVYAFVAITIMAYLWGAFSLIKFIINLF